MTSIQDVKMHEVSRELGTALHHQISSVLKDGIASGRHKPGDRLPGEDELGRLFSVSRITVRRALQSLEALGLIERRKGQGTFVAHSASVMSLATPMDSYLEKVADQRARSKPEVVSFEPVLPPPGVRSALAMAEGALALKVVRVRRRNDLPIMLSTLYLPPHVGERFTRRDFGRKALTELMQERGLHYDRIEVVAGAILADPATAVRLQVAVGAALVDVRRVAYDKEGAPLEHQTIVGPPDRYQLRVAIRN